MDRGRVVLWRKDKARRGNCHKRWSGTFIPETVRQAEEANKFKAKIRSRSRYGMGM